jgi:hypothetical protein
VLGRDGIGCRDVGAGAGPKGLSAVLFMAKSPSCKASSACMYLQCEVRGAALRRSCDVRDGSGRLQGFFTNRRLADRRGTAVGAFQTPHSGTDGTAFPFHMALNSCAAHARYPARTQ